MLDLGEALPLRQWSPDSAGRTLGLDELGMGRLELLKLPEQGVVLRVTDLARTIDVVANAEVIQPRNELGDAGGGLRSGAHGAVGA